MQEAIRAWLNNPTDYGKGAALYFVHGDNERLKALFMKGFSEFNKKELAKALRGLYDREVIPVREDTHQFIKKPKTVITNPVIVIKTGQSGTKTRETVPPVSSPEKNTEKESTPVTEPVVVDPKLLQVTDDAAKTAWKEMMNMRAVLFNQCRVEEWQDENTPDRVRERGKLALEILAFNKRVVNPAFNKLRDLKATGRINTVKSFAADHELVPDAQLKHTIDNLRKALNKNKSKLKDQGPTPERVQKINEQTELLNVLLARWELIK